MYKDELFSGVLRVTVRWNVYGACQRSHQKWFGFQRPAKFRPPSAASLHQVFQEWALLRSSSVCIIKEGFLTELRGKSRDSDP